MTHQLMTSTGQDSQPSNTSKLVPRKLKLMKVVEPRKRCGHGSEKTLPIKMKSPKPYQQNTLTNQFTMTCKRRE